MEFQIADPFSGSLSRLTAQEQRALKTTAFDLQRNPASLGMKFHKINRAGSEFLLGARQRRYPPYRGTRRWACNAMRKPAFAAPNP